jgi:hypothetical protein
MANYLLVVLDQAGHQWLLSLLENQFDTWSDLRQAFIDNFVSTCDRPGNKYDLERIRDRAGEPLRDYIRRFSDMRLKIPIITHDEAVSTFIKGLRHHNALKSKLLQKRPSTVSELLATAKNYADADDAEKIIRETWVGHHTPSTHRVGTINPMTVVGTTTANVATGATTTIIVTAEIIVIGGPIITVITEASVPAKTTMRSTRSRNLLVTVTIKRITTKL